MKEIKTIIFAILMMLVTGCEKDITTDTPKQSEEQDTPSVIDDGQKENALTVAEAIEAEEGSYICVKGYLVASTQRSIKNAVFENPFSGSSAIVLADKKVEENTVYYLDELFPVCLTDCSKSIRNALNLEDNPDNHNHLIYIYGIREKYMSMPGMKKVTDFEIIIK